MIKIKNFIKRGIYLRIMSILNVQGQEVVVSPSFVFLPGHVEPDIESLEQILNRTLGDEATDKFQDRFSGLHTKKRQTALANNVHGAYPKDFPEEDKIETEFLASLLGYTYSVFRRSTRDFPMGGVGDAKGITAYNISHFYTPALIAAQRGLDSFTIYLFVLHDLIEGALDTFFETKSLDYIKSVLSKSNKEAEQELHRFIHNLHNELNKEKLRDKRTVQEDRDSYDLIRPLMLRVVYKDLKDLVPDTHETKVDEETIQSLVVGMHALTRIPGEPYGATIRRTDEMATYSNLTIFEEHPLPIDELEYIRTKVKEVKLLDGLHNLRTQEEILVERMMEEIVVGPRPGCIGQFYERLKHTPVIGKIMQREFVQSRVERRMRVVLIEEAEKRADVLDNRMKSLLKRLYVVNSTKNFLIERTDDAFSISSTYKGIYDLHLLVASQAAEQARRLYEAVLLTYGKREVDDELKAGYGFGKEEPVTYKDIFDKIQGALEPYEQRELLDELTAEGDQVEQDFARDFGVKLGGTILRIILYADKTDEESLYKGFEEDPQKIVDFLKDALVMERLFQRHQAIGFDGGYDPKLREWYLEELIPR